MHAMSFDSVWLGIGLVGQSLFFMRFVVQWIASERQGESVLPRAFWYFSLAGGIVLLAYAVHRRDPVFAIGQATGLLIYSRNLMLRGAQSDDSKAAARGADGDPVLRWKTFEEG